MNTQQALERLELEFVLHLIREGIKERNAYREWAKKHVECMEHAFAYERKTGMPCITSLVNVFFHPDYDQSLNEPHQFIGLNYSPVAHNVLFKFSEGWTAPLRQCRGLVMDALGTPIAIPFNKFFNYNEHPETRELPNEPFVASNKLDGHLGIIFHNHDAFHLTTRGSFQSPTVKFAQPMMRQVAKRKRWHTKGIEKITLRTEIIHPQTKVICDYGRQRHLVLLGAYDRGAYRELHRPELKDLAKDLGLRLADAWEGDSISDLIAYMQDPTVRNQEGFVAHFASDLRVKFKFATYLAQMRAGKISYTYLMNRIMDGRIQEVMRGLPEEILPEAERMRRQVMNVRRRKGDVKELRKYLYGLVPAEESTTYYRTICRDFLRHIS